jgi:formylglycine-generating enzyme required for sulfatase activity
MTAGFWSGNQPSATINWYQAAAFTNWLNTSTGHQAAYQLNVGLTELTLWPSADAWQVGGENLYRNKNAQYFLTSENEWYTAAYYNSANQTYSLFANGTNSVTPGDANFSNVVRHTTDVGTYSSDPSYYGTFD